MRLDLPGHFVTKFNGTCRWTFSPTCYSGRARSSIQKKVGSEGTPNYGPYRKLQPVACKVNCINFQKWNRKLQRCSPKNMRWDWMHVLLRADQRLKHNHKDVFSASSSTKTIPIGERTWTDVEPQDYSPPIIQCRRNWSIFFVMVVFFEKMMERLNSGDEKIIFRTIIIVLTTSGRNAWQDEEEKRKILQYCTDFSGDMLYLRALQGHSGRSLIDPSSQDSVLIPNVFFKYTYHVGCAIKLQSIINSGLISGGQNFEQETDGILSACESYGQRTQRSWDNRPESTAPCTVHADSVEGTSEHGFFLVDIKLGLTSSLLKRMGSEVSWQEEGSQPT